MESFYLLGENKGLEILIFRKRNMKEQTISI